MVLVSIVTEGEGKTKDNEKRGWHPSTVEPGGREGYRGRWGNQEENDGADASYRRQDRAFRPDGRGRVLDGVEDDMQSGSSKEHREMRRACLERVEAAAGLGFDELRRRHVDDVEALFGRVHLSIESPSDGSRSATEGSDVDLSSSGSCIAGLPIRTRVSRSGKACTEEGEEGLDATEGFVGGDSDERTVVDDGLIELMYHYGR